MMLFLLKFFTMQNKNPYSEQICLIKLKCFIYLQSHAVLNVSAVRTCLACRDSTHSLHNKRWMAHCEKGLCCQEELMRKILPPECWTNFLAWSIRCSRDLGIPGSFVALRGNGNNKAVFCIYHWGPAAGLLTSQQWPFFSSNSHTYTHSPPEHPCFVSVYLRAALLTFNEWEVSEMSGEPSVISKIGNMEP